MALAGTGPIGAALEALRDLISQSTTFQTLVGAANAAAAEASIHFFREDLTTDTMPCAVIFFGMPNAHQMTTFAGGAENWFQDEATADVWFQCEVPEAQKDDESDYMMWAVNQFGGILSDLKALSGEGTNLNVTRMEKVSGPSRSGKEENDNLVQAAYRFTWWGK